MPSNETLATFHKSEFGEIGEGPIDGHEPPFAGSLLYKQKYLAAKRFPPSTKPPKKVTEKDAAETQSEQERVLGTEAEKISGGLAEHSQNEVDDNDVKKMEHRTET